jgi:hypothetical protein
MSDRQIAVRRLAESLDLPPEVADEVLTWPSMFGPEPIHFPEPREMLTADMVQETADLLQLEYPHRSLLDCRQLAERLVDVTQCWEAEYAG